MDGRQVPIRRIEHRAHLLGQHGGERGHAPELDLVLEVVGHERAAVIVAERDTACDTGGNGAEHGLDRHADGLGSGVAVTNLGNVPSESLGIPVLATANSQTLPSSTVGICVASVPHIRFGASVVMRPSWAASERGRWRCGDSRPFSRISRRIRLRATRRQPRPHLAMTLADPGRTTQIGPILPEVFELHDEILKSHSPARPLLHELPDGGRDNPVEHRILAVGPRSIRWRGWTTSRYCADTIDPTLMTRMPDIPPA